MPRFFQGTRCTNTVRLEGKVAVITGGSAGIGRETARELSRRGATVLIACRDIEKAQKTADEIFLETDNRVITVRLDLASLDSVRIAAAEVQDYFPDGIDLLINNAGVMMTPKSKTADGFEMQLGVNHLGHFLWTLLLLESVEKAAPSRIINLSSLAHTEGKIHFDDLMLEKKYTPTISYYQSKLANILFTKELARRLEGTGVTCYAVHPGIVRTDLWQYLNDNSNCLTQRFLMFSSDTFFKTPEMGAQTTIYCATEPELETQSGLYYSDCAETKPAKQARDMAAALKLWEISEKLVKEPEELQ